MSLNLFWFLPTHGDSHYLGTEEGFLQLFCNSAATRLHRRRTASGFTSADQPGAHVKMPAAGRRVDDPSHPASEVLIALRPGVVSPPWQRVGRQRWTALQRSCPV